MLQGIIATTEAEATMKDAFSQMLSYGIRYLPVLDERSKLVGMVTSDDAQRLVEQTNKVLMST